MSVGGAMQVPGAPGAPSGAHGDSPLPLGAFDSLGDGLLSHILSFLDQEGRNAPRAAHPRLRAAADALVREVQARSRAASAREWLAHLLRHAARWPRGESLKLHCVWPTPMEAPPPGMELSSGWEWPCVPSVHNPGLMRPKVG